MKYIIDEIELKDLIKSLLDVPDEEDIKDIEDDFLKDKKPVECIASNGFLYLIGDGYEWTGYAFDKEPSKFADKDNNVFEKDNYKKPDFRYYFSEQLKKLDLDKYKGKNIEIYIKEK